MAGSGGKDKRIVAITSAKKIVVIVSNKAIITEVDVRGCIVTGGEIFTAIASGEGKFSLQKKAIVTVAQMFDAPVVSGHDEE